MPLIDEARIYADLIRDKNRLKAQIAGVADVIQILKRFSEIINVDDLDIVISTRDTTADGMWDIGFSNGVDHNGTWDGVGYVWATDDSYTQSLVEVCRRVWSYNTQSDLSNGSYSLNITISNNDVRLNI